MTLQKSDTGLRFKSWGTRHCMGLLDSINAMNFSQGSYDRPIISVLEKLFSLGGAVILTPLSDANRISFINKM